MDSIIPYVTLLDADIYITENCMNPEAWDLSSPERQMIALRRATISIDALSFRGSKTSLTQINQFPRNGLTVVPDQIQQACCEIALCLLDGVDTDLEEETLGTVTDAYATVRATSDPTVRQDHLRAGIPSPKAWKLLLPYLNDPQALVFERG